MTDDDYAVVQAMIIFGGSFVSALGQAWRQADLHNQARLKATFPDYWSYYQELATAKRTAEKEPAR